MTTSQTTTNIAFACVWTGDFYGIEYVVNLQKSLAKHAPPGVPFICFTEERHKNSLTSNGIKAIVFPQNWEGWWNKIQLFDETVAPFYRHLIFLDLDIVVLKSLGFLLEIVEKHDLVCAPDSRGGLSSSMLVIDRASELSKEVVRRFDYLKDKKVFSNDQEYLKSFLSTFGGNLHLLNSETHYSYKHLINFNGWTQKAPRNSNYGPAKFQDIVSLNFHGRPKPKDLLIDREDWPYSQEIIEAWTHSPPDLSK